MHTTVPRNTTEVAPPFALHIRRRGRSPGAPDTDQDPIWHDELTGFLNRRWWSQFCRRTRPVRSRAWRFLLLDVDQLREWNHRRGYTAGDHCLARIARRLSRSLGQRAPIVRLGGDEFGIAWAADSAMDVWMTHWVWNITRPSQIRPTLSAGVVAMRSPGRPAWNRLVDAAYRALQTAKRRRSSRVVWQWV
jgi:diguanylate cyclase (GGDEF)-like protein